MKQRPLKIIIVSLVTIFLLANFSSSSQGDCFNSCPECQKIITEVCCQNSMTANTPAHSSTSNSSQNSCNHDQFCSVTEEHTNLFISSSSQSLTFPLLAFTLFTLEHPPNSSKLIPEIFPTNHIYTDIQLHILHCSFII